MHSILKKTRGTETVNSCGIGEALVDSEADLSNLPEDLMPGSTAYTASMDGIWMKDNAGRWKRIGGDG